MRAKFMAKSKSAPSKPKTKSGSRSPEALTQVQRDVLSARAEYEASLKQMVSARRDKLRGEDRYWEIVGTILTKRLYVLDEGASTANEWIDKHTGENPRTARRNVRVAHVASPEQELRYGFTKIDLALTWRDTKEKLAAEKAGREWVEKELPAPIKLEALQFSVVRKKKAVTVSLEEITTDELRTLVTGLSQPAKHAEHKPSKTAAALTAVLAKHELDEVLVHERDAMITVGPFRADQTVAVGRALVATRAPSVKTAALKPAPAKAPAKKPTPKKAKSPGKKR